MDHDGQLSLCRCQLFLMRGEKTAEEAAELTALLRLYTSPSAPHPQRNRHLCALILGSMKTHICCQE